MTSFKSILGILFTLLVLTVAFLSISAFKNNKESTDRYRWVMRTHQVLEKIENISSLVKDRLLAAESSVQADGSLSATATLTKSISNHVVDLWRLTTDNRQTQMLVDSLKMYLATWQSHQLQDELSPGANVQALLQRIKSIELQLLKEREHLHDETSKQFSTIMLWLTGCVGTLILSTFVSIHHHFNKRVDAERQTKNASELFEKLFYAGPMAVLISHPDTGAIIDCNTVFEQMTGYNRETVIHNPQLISGCLAGSRVTFARMLVQLKKDGAARSVDLKIKPYNRRAIWISLSIQIILINERPCMLSVASDVTAHKLAKEKMEKALAYEIELNKMKSNFVTQASHEFRTPLTTILSSTFLLQQYISHDERKKTEKHFLRIKTSVNDLTTQLDSLLQVTKPNDDSQLTSRNPTP
jgi:PAS domain S-box-containing protein